MIATELQSDARNDKRGARQRKPANAHSNFRGLLLNK